MDAEPKVEAVLAIEPTVKLRQKRVTKQKNQKKNHNTHLGLEPWTTGTVGKCTNHCTTTASYPLPLLFYLINVTHVVVSVYSKKNIEEETKAEPAPNANANCCVL